MRWVLFACVMCLSAGSASAQASSSATAAASSDRTASSGASVSTVQAAVPRPAAVPAARPDSLILRPDAYAASAQLTAWRRLRDFLVGGGGFLSLVLLMLVWRFRTPRDEIDAIRAALTAEGRRVDSVRRRGGLTCRAAGGAHRTYDVVLIGRDGEDQPLIVGVRARWFRPGALAEFDRQGRFVRVARPETSPAEPPRDLQTSSPRPGSIAA